MKRRKFIALIGGAVAGWPIAARAQQPALPVVGVLDPRFPGVQDLLRAFHQGLRETGYVEGQNVAIEYHWAEGHYERLPTLAAELVRRRVAVIAAISPATAAVAKAAMTTLPIVFLVNEDPVRRGLVASLAHPGGNLTGINIFTSEVAAKRLNLLCELMPSATHVGVGEPIRPLASAVARSDLRPNDIQSQRFGLRHSRFRVGPGGMRAEGPARCQGIWDRGHRPPAMPAAARAQRSAMWSKRLFL